MTAENELNVDELYARYAKIIIDDSRVTQELDPTMKITIGDKSFSPAGMADEITNRTDIGTSYLRNYHYGLQFLQKDN